MAEIKYIKDLQRNYLVAVLSEQYQEGYQTTMISKNQIGELLPCNVRRMNGRWLVCYEISRFQSLKEFCLSQQISWHVYRGLLHSLSRTIELLAHFLLDSRNLSLHPEHIFVSGETTDCYFCYFPGEDQAAETGIRILSQFLIDHLDDEDIKLMRHSYRLYRMAQDTNFNFFQYINEIQKNCDFDNDCQKRQEEEILAQSAELADGEKIEEFSETQDHKRQLSAGNHGGQKEQAEEQSDIEFFDAQSVYESKQPASDQKATYAKARGWYALLKEKIGRGNKEGRQTGAHLPSYAREDAFFYGEQFSETQKEQFARSAGMSPEKETKRRLIGQGEASQIVFVIENFPFVIGSLSYAVDGYLDSDGISRFHARLDFREQEYFLTDLHTMSGTFLNGERLEENGVRKILPGDQVQFGTQTFLFE